MVREGGIDSSERRMRVQSDEEMRDEDQQVEDAKKQDAEEKGRKK